MNDNYFQFAVCVKDYHGVPVSGKFPLNIKFISAFSNQNNINVSLFNGFTGKGIYIPTNDLGFSSFEGFIRQKYVESGEYSFQVIFDGTTSNSQNIIYINLPLLSDFCILLSNNISENIELVLKDDETFSIELIALNSSNENYYAPTDIRFNFFYSDYNHLEGSFFSFDNQIMIYKAYTHFKNLNLILKEDQYNLYLNKFDFKGMLSGSYLVYISAQKRNEDLINQEFITFCTTKLPLLIHYKNSVSKVNILNSGFSEYLIFTIFPEDNKFNLSIQLLDLNDSPLSKFTTSIKIRIYQFPFYFSFLFQVNSSILDNLFSFIINDNVTNGNGTLENVTIVTPEQFQGLYAISIEVNGISSVPFYVNNSIPIDKINILEEKVDAQLNMWETVKPIFVFIEGKLIQNIPIIAFFYSNEIETDFDINDENNYNFIGNTHRLRTTNSSGVAEFNSLSLFAYDNQNISKECINGHFYFKVATFPNISRDSLSNYTFCINFQLAVVDFHSYHFDLFIKLSLPIIIEFNIYNF